MEKNPFCPKCKKRHKGKCKTKKGSYGLGPEEVDDGVLEDEILDTASEEGSMNESYRTERKALDSFRDAAKAAKERQEKRKKENADLVAQTRQKGVRFYDSKGSGYIRKGKKHYD